MISSLSQIVEAANKGAYAVGAFNVHNLETLTGVVDAAIAENSPAIIQVSEGGLKYFGLKTLVALFNVEAERAANIPLVLHLDHGRDLDLLKACIAGGFQSVHIDASHLPLRENIALTKEIVALAHQSGLSVQGEVGSIQGGHGDVGGVLEGIVKADPAEVLTFAADTGVDTVAPAIGTAHGSYQNEDVDLALLEIIRQQVTQPLVMHGGSGISDELITSAIKGGISIINIGTDIKQAFVQSVRQAAMDQNVNDPRQLMQPARAAVAAVAAGRMRVFGSSGRA